MFPIPGFDEVQVVWIEVKKEGFSLYGFLLYTNSDKVLVEFMKDGIMELDYLSGNECVIFVIESPSKDWIQHTKRNNHSWWKLFGRETVEKSVKESSEDIQQNTSSNNRSWWKLFGRETVEKSVKESSEDIQQHISFFKNFVLNNRQLAIVIGDEDAMVFEQIINPTINLPYNRSEALKIAKHFGLEYKDVPCLIFFRDLEGSTIWKSSLKQYKEHDEVKDFFREFFGSADFKSLL